MMRTIPPPSCPSITGNAPYNQRYPAFRNRGLGRLESLHAPRGRRHCECTRRYGKCLVSGGHQKFNSWIVKNSRESACLCKEFGF
jgi:hypothetical protein